MSDRYAPLRKGIGTAAFEIPMGFIRKGWKSEAEEKYKEGTDIVSKMQENKEAILFNLQADIEGERKRIDMELHPEKELANLYTDVITQLQSIPEGYGEQYVKGLEGMYGETTKPPDYKYFTMGNQRLRQDVESGKVDVIYEQQKLDLLEGKSTFDVTMDEEGNLQYWEIMPIIDKKTQKIVDSERISISQGEYEKGAATIEDKLMIKYSTLKKLEDLGIKTKSGSKGTKGKKKTSESLATIKNKSTPEQWAEFLKNLSKDDIYGFGMKNLEFIAGEEGLREDQEGWTQERLEISVPENLEKFGGDFGFSSTMGGLSLPNLGGIGGDGREGEPQIDKKISKRGVYTETEKKRYQQKEVYYEKHNSQVQQVNDKFRQLEEKAKQYFREGWQPNEIEQWARENALAIYNTKGLLPEIKRELKLQLAQYGINIE